jgi:hypothetical protein
MAEENSWELRDFAGRVKGRSLESFRAAYPHPFLLVLGHEEDQTAAFRTGKVNVAPAAPAIGDPPSKTPDRLVPVRKSDRNSFQNMISVGRATNNDIVLDHGSVSKLHAFFRPLPDGTGFLLTDSGSSNGTTVDGRRVLPNRGVRLESGQSVVFGGAVKTLFLTPEGIHEHIRGLLFFKKL